VLPLVKGEKEEEEEEEEVVVLPLLLLFAVPLLLLPRRLDDDKDDAAAAAAPAPAFAALAMTVRSSLACPSHFLKAPARSASVIIVVPFSLLSPPLPPPARLLLKRPCFKHSS